MNSKDIIEKMLLAGEEAAPGKSYVTRKNVAAIIEMGIRLYFHELRMWLDERLGGQVAPAVEAAKPEVEVGAPQEEFELSATNDERKDKASDLAALLGMSDTFFLAAARQGVIPCTCRGKRVFFNTAEAVNELRRLFFVQNTYDGKARREYLHSVRVIKKNNPNKLFYKQQEIVDFIGVTDSVLQNWRRNGLPHFAFPRVTELKNKETSRFPRGSVS